MASTTSEGSSSFALEIHVNKVIDGSYEERNGPFESIDQVSHVSELSSMGLGSVGDEVKEDHVEQITRDALLSSQRRRSQRRQWNPSYHSSGPSFPALPLPEGFPCLAQPLALTHPVEEPPSESNSTNDRDTKGDSDSESEKKDSSDISQDEEDPNASSENDSHEFSGEDSLSAIDENCRSNNNFSKSGSPDSKFDSYSCLVDRSQDDRSVEINLYSMKRPHMRAFHLSWISFFFAFFTWFAITPLLGEVMRSLSLNRKEVWTSSTYGVAGSAVTRILIGPLCDKYGARWVMAGTLFVSAIPTALTGLVQTLTGLNVLRLFIGVAGSSFVTCQYWTSSMFTVEVAGTANALVAGWGNLGGGVTQIMMGSVLFPLFKFIFAGGYDRELSEEEKARASDFAWRSVCVVPALICLIICYMVLRYSDDSPKGNYIKRSRQGLIPQVSAFKSIRHAVSDHNTWLLFIQYGCCFGVEITMVNAAALYFTEKFGQSTESAAAIASIFGWMNLFSRGLGGFASDMTNSKFGMRGRLWVQVITLILEGVLVIIFGSIETLSGAIVVMVILSILVQAAEGSTFGIVPYVQHSVTGSVSGVVGAGGNMGGVVFAILFREFDNWRLGFVLMGSVAIASALCSFVFLVEGHSGLLFGSDCDEVMQRRNDHNEEFGQVPRLNAVSESERTFAKHGDAIVSTTMNVTIE